MRVITGSARGRKLLQPANMDIRPTTDQVKEALFNIVQFDLEGRRVLDLFAGTGQLGIEALSRGAESCLFLDESKAAVDIVRENVSRCGFENARILRCDSLGYLRSGEQFDVIFIDPPYGKGLEIQAVEAITAEVKKYAKQPIIMKLSPNVTDITEMARAAEAGGADALSLINTITGMKIDIDRRKFVLANKTGGMSGPAIHPVAVRMVYQTAQAVHIPIIGMGGIMTAADAIEMLLAGATAVSVGTANFVDPHTSEKIVEGIEAYMMKYGVEDINELVGAVHA